ncbi:Uncharacterized protein LOK49_LG12G02785 [Camellia lanceoleosa]|uniref:Uncharacterized protein n=1 Tax=Camellia lanceoleosa TaxID=1840588 RepID=A0ACC0FTD0_9ERIC|nr:Uncharacterized protein LOK49_LG12G02785 [Camellia lanceoleosa]
MIQVLLKPIVSQLVAELPTSLEEFTSIPSIKEVDDLLVVCVGQMAVIASNDLLWKPLNHEEPLCGSISSQLTNSLQGLHIASELEQVVQLVTNDKLDLGCALIEQAATEKVLRRPYLFLSRRKLATHAKIWLNKCGLRGRADQSSLDTTTAILSSHNIALTKPDNVEMVEWKAFVKQQTSKEFKLYLNKLKQNTGNQKELSSHSVQGLEEQLV